MFACSWPCLPLPRRGPQDASEVVAVEAPTPVPEPLVDRGPALRSCPTCGAELTDGRRRYCSDACKPKRNGHDLRPLPDLTERPMRGQSYEAEWLAEQLKPPRMPWDT